METPNAHTVHDDDAFLCSTRNVGENVHESQSVRRQQPQRHSQPHSDLIVPRTQPVRGRACGAESLLFWGHHQALTNDFSHPQPHSAPFAFHFSSLCVLLLHSYADTMYQRDLVVSFHTRHLSTPAIIHCLVETARLSAASLPSSSLPSSFSLRSVCCFFRQEEKGSDCPVSLSCTSWCY